MQPRWNGADPYKQEEPIRRLIRDRLPNGSHGFVAEDLDLLTRYYGPRYRTDGTGRIRGIEMKAKLHPSLHTAQDKTFRLVDDLMAGRADPSRYEGLWVVGHNGLGFDNADSTLFSVKRLGSTGVAQVMDTDEFVVWLDTPPTG